MILNSMREIFSCFEGGSSEVKREWRALVSQTDSDIEVGLQTPDLSSVPSVWGVSQKVSFR